MPDKEKKSKDWFWGRLLNPEDKERDVKLLIFVVGAVMTSIWLTKEQARGAITEHWVESLKWYLLSISLGGAGWAAIDKWIPRRSSPTEPPQ